MDFKWMWFLKTSIERGRERATKLLEESSFILNKTTLIGVIGVSLIAPLMVLGYFTFLHHHTQVLEEKMHSLERRVKSLIELKNQQENFVKEFGSSDEQFIQNSVEPLQFLQEDSALLAKMDKYMLYEPLQARLAFLIGKENQMQFLPLAERKSAYYTEIEWHLDHRVEVGCKDIRQILSLIEGVKISPFYPHPLRPQLIIKKFSLLAKEGEDRKIFYLDIDVLQRSCHEKN